MTTSSNVFYLHQNGPGNVPYI